MFEFEHNLKLRDENKQLALQNLRYDEMKNRWMQQEGQDMT